MGGPTACSQEREREYQINVHSRIFQVYEEETPKPLYFVPSALHFWLPLQIPYSSPKLTMGRNLGTKKFENCHKRIMHFCISQSILCLLNEDDLWLCSVNFIHSQTVLFSNFSNKFRVSLALFRHLCAFN